MSKRSIRPGDRITLTQDGRPVLTTTVRRVGCRDPDCPSCEGHWREEPLPPRPN